MVGLVFGQTVRHEFVNFDDDRYVYENPQIAHGLTVRGTTWVFTHIHSANWHPLTGLSHMLDCQMYGLNAGGHHLTNVLLHAATAVLLFLVLQQMTAALWPSALVAALFAVHPLRVESVAWIAERKDVLSGLCFVLTLWAYVWYVRGPSSWRRYLLVVIALAVGLMAKPMLVTTPFVLLLLDYWPLGRFAGGRLRLGWRLVREKIPLFLLAALSCLVTVFVQGEASALDKDIPLLLRAANAMVSYVTYVGQFFYPVSLAAYYPHPGSRLPLMKALAAVLVLVCTTALVTAYGRRWPYLLVGWLWYLGMLVPVIGFLLAGSQARADRFTYLPHIGLCLALVFAAADVGRAVPVRRAIGALGAALVLVLLMGSAWRQTTFWSDSETLWTHALACNARNAVAHYSLGIALADRQRLDMTIAHYQQAMEINPDCAEAHNNLGVALTRLGRVEEALAHYQRALAIRPDYVMARCNLGSVLANRGQFEEAIGQFQQALNTRPDHAPSHCRLANTLAMAGRLSEATAHYQAALELDPYSAEAHCNLGNILARQGRLDEATAHYEAVLRVQPDNAEAHCQLGNALACQDHLDEAAAHLHRALEIEPNHAAAHNSLALVLVGQGHSDQALTHYRQALALQPNNPEFQKSLAWLRATSPERSLRNGAEAVELAEKANRLSGGKRADVLDTLAAAYAEAGWFPEALAAERKALELALEQHDPAAEAIRGRLALYETARPYRQTRATSAPSSIRP